VSKAGAIDEGPSDGSGIDDQVPIQASVGEYIIPKDVVEIKGREFFDRLIEKYHTPAEEQRQEAAPPRYQPPPAQHRSMASRHNVNSRRMAIG
jgi:hypothetical protein